jgi:ketosteroid isomerase-like protein
MPHTHAVPEVWLDGLIQSFEQLQAKDVAHMGNWYAPDASFKDPFKEVQGLPQIQSIFAHMFESLEQPRFVVTSRMLQGKQCFLVWDFLFRFKTMQPGVEQRIRGGSHLVMALNANNEWRVVMHRDYWDAAEELYEKLPWVSGLIRWLKRRVNS